MGRPKNWRRSGLMIVAAGWLMAATTVPGAGQQAAQRVAPGDPAWQLLGDASAGVERGRPALRFGTGEAYLPSVRFERGTIEFDVALSALRTFFGVRFRAASTGAFEEIYLRPHKSGLPDALQYAPAFAGGRSQWQLYHGPGETAASTFDHTAWTHVRVVVEGRRAALFLDGASEPALVVPRLARDPAAGFVGFWSLDASESRGPGRYRAAISNLVITPGAADVAWPPVDAAAAPESTITSWEVSEAFAAPASGPILEIPAGVRSGRWRSVPVEPDGLLLFDREVAWPDGVARVAALARIRMRGDGAGARALQLGFSDDASVFLNGRLLYAGTNSYSYNFPRRDGLLTPDQALVPLPLVDGENELVVAVADRFGGWGLSGRLIPAGSGR